MRPQGPGVLSALQTFEVSVGLLLCHLATFDRRTQVFPGVPNADVASGIIELI